ncbi:Uncharacterised protein [Bordetella pertussis]|nr:Uncharacterised protein [Bordetella pertussis]CFU70147.1 Uncharacterised protein [Bordetella pertussis]CFW39012.1 Uncharacterised protein [Bordetella pertussis]CPO50207.1 Uncharacterised protein [Bordetella pertussis]
MLAESGMRTWSRMRLAAACAALASQAWCRRMASTICAPTVNTGLSEVMGSWKIMPRSLPRMARMLSSEAAARSTASPAPR